MSYTVRAECFKRPIHSCSSLPLLSLLSFELTLKRYKFNWANPAANWKLNLEDELQWIIMFQIIAINNVESEFSKNSSNRGDTSQNVRPWMHG